MSAARKEVNRSTGQVGQEAPVSERYYNEAHTLASSASSLLRFMVFSDAVCGL
jgi:hypothetical protein